MGTLTKKGALSVSTDLDKAATLFLQDYKTLGIPKHIAADFAHRCDLLSDAVEKHAGLVRNASGDFDPSDIGEGKAGPLEGDSDESSYMRGEFSQQENRELREKEESGRLAQPETSPAAPRPGVQAAMSALTAATHGVESHAVEQAIRLALTVAQAAKDEEDEDEEKEEGKEASTHGYKLDA